VRPPTGDACLHEVKFDGWRIQLHKCGRDVAIYTRRGHAFTARLRSITAAVAALSARSAIIDAELTACERDFRNFEALHFRTRHHHLCVWAFDLLELNGRHLRELPLTKPKDSPKKLLSKTRDIRLRFSASFDGGEKLLALAEGTGLEGIVPKRRDYPYRSVRCDWIKVKSPAWREANRDRHELIKNSTQTAAAA
jgi:bifunctional non-homologous end joining protein LigD